MRGRKSMFLPFKWIGMNAMLVYVMAAQGIFDGFINGWYYNDPRNTLVSFSSKTLERGVEWQKKIATISPCSCGIH